MLHHNINTGPGVLLSSSKIIRSRQFLEKKKPTSGSIGGRRKKSVAKKLVPVKGRSGSKKDKQPIEFADPPSKTQNEDDSASSSERTTSHNTEENLSGKEKGPIEEEQSASLEHENTGADGLGEEDVHNNNDQEMAENIVHRIMEEIDLQAHEASEVYCEWFRYRCDKFYKQMLPGLTAGQRFERFMEIEENVINLTEAKDPSVALDRHAIVEPCARLQKLAEHIRKLTKRYIPGTPKSQLQLLVLDILAVKKGEFIDEVVRLEAVREQQNTTHSPRHENADGQNQGDNETNSPLADQDINVTDDRTEPPLTDNLEFDQVRDSEPTITEEKVITIMNEFANTVVRPWKNKIKKAKVQVIKLAETTRDDLSKANELITSVETNHHDADIRYEAHLKRTIALEETTSKLVDDFESVNRRIIEMERVISLEEKNASLEERNTKLEADFKAVTEQVAELIKAKIAANKAIEEANVEAAKKLQDALDEENRKKKEAPRSDANFNERLRILTAKNPELAKSIAAQEAKDAERFNTEKQRYDEYAKAHKKTKVAPSSSAPATRKRKVPSRKAQVIEMLGRITETVVDPPPNPALQTKDDFEEDLESRSTRQRVFEAVPVRTSPQFIKPEDRKCKRKASGSTSGRKKKTASKKAISVKEKSGTKGDGQSTGSANPRPDTPNNENSASSSGQTISQHIGGDQSGKGKEPIVEEQSVSHDNADAGSDRLRKEDESADEHTRKTAEDLVSRIMDEIHQQAHAASDVYYQWVLHRHRILYKNMLPDLTVSQKFERLVEIEEEVISLTKAQDVTTALGRSKMVEPHARLQGLTEHIQHLQEKHIPGTPDSSLELLVLNLLVVKEKDLIEEMARLEAEPEHQENSNLSRSPPEDVGSQNPTDNEQSSPSPE
ncbi:CAP-Gly domain-containing linker protein 1-like [Impatiens glandulifera]|uniref:CAP-Gly domain-containing linker protein 1-like n=1 Tax=Impatiens glandulifera TaxID=253017 RepID=UPI001FB0FB83|nr:CAP-Gly domain-containing linker protein 1-like [Impatiens glandulifera]